MARPHAVAASRREAADERPPFAELQRELIADLMPQGVDFAPGSHSLGQRYLRRSIPHDVQSFALIHGCS